MQVRAKCKCGAWNLGESVRGLGTQVPKPYAYPITRGAKKKYFFRRLTYTYTQCKVGEPLGCVSFLILENAGAATVATGVMIPPWSIQCERVVPGNRDGISRGEQR